MGSLGWLRWVVRVGAFEVLVTLLPLISNAPFEDLRGVGISTVLREHKAIERRSGGTALKQREADPPDRRSDQNRDSQTAG
jgi:hypothetical protein